MRLTVVTPWLDRPHFIPDYEAAVRAPGVEVVIVDNGSSAENARRLRDLVARLGGKLVRNETNRWFAAANNQGLAAATGDAVVFLSNDVWAPGPGWLAAAGADIDRHPGALLGPTLLQLSAGEHKVPFLEGWCVGASRGTLERIGGWNERLFTMPCWEDAELCVRAVRLGHPLLRTAWQVRHKGRGTSAEVAGTYAAADENLATLLAIIEGREEEISRPAAPAPGTGPDVASALHESGRLSDAEPLYRQWLARHPDDAVVLNKLGVLCHQTGREEEAETLLRRSVELGPAIPDVHNNFGLFLLKTGRPGPAAEALVRCVSLAPRHAHFQRSLGTALESCGRFPEAESAFRAAVELAPGDAAARHLLGNVLEKQRRLDEALDAQRSAVDTDPRHAEAWRSLGRLYSAGGLRQAEAVRCFREAQRLNPRSSGVGSDLLLAMHYDPCEHEPANLARAHADWARRHAPSPSHTFPPRALRGTAGEPLRIGYVSADFREHPVARFVSGVLRHHDRAAFRVYCYSDVARPDGRTAEIRASADVWRDVGGMKLPQVAELVRGDGIDVLVDLGGHTSNRLLLLFAKRPAPLQVTCFNYPNTTGLAAVDYRLSDATSDPPGPADGLYAEKLLRLPGAGWCYECSEPAPPVGPPPCERSGVFTFGCLNNPAKVTAETVASWAAVLHAVPSSRLLLLAAGGRNDLLLAALRDGGIDPTRIELADYRPRYDYLELYNRIDAALDTFPYNGGVTTCDALYMGVPVVTRAGPTYASRQGRMILHSVGLAECVTDSPDTYVHAAVSLGQNPDRVGRLRGALRVRFLGSAVGDAAGFIRRLEENLLRIWAGPVGKNF